MDQLTLQDRLIHRPGQRFTGHRRPKTGSVIVASLVAGAVFLALQVAVEIVLYGQSPWAFFHMTNAMMLGAEAIEPRNVFELGPVGGALAIHFALALIYGAILTNVIGEFTPRMKAFAGIAFGVLLYLVNFHGFTGLFPWFAELRGAGTIAAHAGFGLTLALAFTALQRRATAASA